MVSRGERYPLSSGSPRAKDTTGRTTGCPWDRGAAADVTLLSQEHQSLTVFAGDTRCTFGNGSKDKATQGHRLPGLLISVPVTLQPGGSRVWVQEDISARLCEVVLKQKVWVGVRVHGLRFIAPDPRPGNKDSHQTDTLTHPQALGTEHCRASASQTHCGRAPGVRRVLKLLLCFVLGEKRGGGIQWNPGPRSLEKPECNSHQGFHHTGEATGNLSWQRCSRADSDCLGWEEIQTD